MPTKTALSHLPIVSATDWQLAQTPPYRWWRRHDEYGSAGR